MPDDNIKSFGGKWSDEKLGALKEYLRAYTTALKNAPFKLTYIDAFAGAGTREVAADKDADWFDESILEEDVQYRHGSPLIALGTEPSFHEFFFIERDPESMDRLKNEVRDNFPVQEKKVSFLPGDANQVIQSLTSKRWDSRRAVAFLDPFALHVTWETIEKIARTQAIDMWLLFPAMAINRMMPKHGEIPEAWASKLTETFGCEEWRKFFYEKSEPDLFGEATLSKSDKFFQRLSEFITMRLKTVFAGAHESPLILRNKSGAPIFLLCFACGNPKGVQLATRIAQHIINKKNHGK